MPVLTPELIARHAATIQQDPAPKPVSSADRDRFSKIGLPALIGGNVADLATTLQAISSGRAQEANPAMRGSTGKMIAMKAGTTAAEAYLLDRLAKKNPKAAFLAALAIGGFGAGLAVHNSRVGKK